MHDTSYLHHTSAAYSYLGFKALNGNVEALKFLYADIQKEAPPVIRTVCQLQECLTSVEIENDTTRIYNDEFLYYWGMICLGELSRLIQKDLGTATSCFEKIKNTVSHASARLAYIKLLQSREPTTSENNIRSLDILRKWATQRDLFSSIIMAKILFYQFLCENEEQPDGYPGTPNRVLNLLQLPLQKGHPVAVRLYKEILNYEYNSMIAEVQTNEPYINPKVLYDFEGPSILRRNTLCPATNIIVVNDNDNPPSLAKGAVLANNNVTQPTDPAPYISEQTIRIFAKMSPKSFKHRGIKPESSTKNDDLIFMALKN